MGVNAHQSHLSRTKTGYKTKTPQFDFLAVHPRPLSRVRARGDGEKRGPRNATNAQVPGSSCADAVHKFFSIICLAHCPLPGGQVSIFGQNVCRRLSSGGPLTARPRKSLNGVFPGIMAFFQEQCPPSEANLDHTVIDQDFFLECATNNRSSILDHVVLYHERLPAEFREITRRNSVVPAVWPDKTC